MLFIFLYILISIFALIKVHDYFEKREKDSYRRMVGKFPRPPGYHLGEQLSDMSFSLMGYMFSIMLAPVFVYVILHKLHWSVSVAVSIPIQGIIVWRMIPFINKMRAYKKGQVAELKVGMALSSKLPHSCSVHHDIQLADIEREGSNVDHLIITPQEIYLIDTKYRRALRENESNYLYYNGSVVQFGQGGFKDVQDLKSIQSVKSQFLGYLQREGIPKLDVPIRCVLIYPGWLVDFKEALATRPPAQVSTATALINRITARHSGSKILAGSTLDRIDQLLDAKNIVRTKKL